jgi:hypothetical protein
MGPAATAGSSGLSSEDPLMTPEGITAQKEAAEVGDFEI